MSDPTDPLPTASRLPDDAKHLGLLPITAPELQVAAALRSDKPLHKAFAWLALLIILGGLIWGIVRAFIG